MAAVARPPPPSRAGSRHHYMHSTARAPYAVQHDYDYDYDFDSAIPAQYAAAPGPSTSGALSPAAALVNSWRTNAAAALESDAYHHQPTDYYSPQSPMYAAPADYSHRHRSPNRGPKPTRSSRPPSGLSSSNAASGSRLSLDQQYGYPPQSPATTADFVPSSSSHRARIHAAPGAVPPLPPPVPAPSSQRNHHVHPSSSAGAGPKYSSSHAAASRSSVSLSQHPNSSSRAAGSRYHHSSRNAYDADYDRQLATGPAAGSTAASSSSRGLFDPRAQASAGTASSSSSRRLPGAASSSPRRGHGEDRSRTRHGSSTTSTVSPHPSAASTLHPAPLTSVPHAGAADAPPPSPRSAKRQPGTGERASRSSATADDRRATRSKREPVQLMDLGRRAGADRSSRLEPGQHSHGRQTSDAKDSHESLESLQTDFSGRTKSSGAVGGRRRRRAGADGEGEDGEFESGLAGLANAAAGGSSKSRQLFDPRKDDPMRFAAPRPGSVASSTSKHAFPSGLTGSTFTLQTESVMNLPETSGIDDAASGHAPAPSSSSHSKRPDHPILAELKKAYRGILELEKKLQDEHRKVTREAERDADAATGQSASSASGVKIQGQGKKYDDAYWVKLAKAHKQLAEAHYSFLQMALDPNIPAGLHSLPQRYNIPTRLWQVAFHQLLERMRHAVVSSPPLTGTDPNEANVLDHLIEFIQFAYTHYSQLFEDPAVSVFRAAWIEQLGDLARYRMAVAGLASRVHAAQEANSDLSAEALQGREDSNDSRTAAARARPADAASIGQAALNDWDLEEQETWREMAREWYALGLAESPGTGRLQHHLALLSKGDELRALYHYTKSLTTVHPYQSARESILPLFEEEHQSRRTQSDVSQHELFVHLHGMLFTKISLDDFEDCLERFLERLRQEAWSLEKAAQGLSSPYDAEPGLSFADRNWCMLGIINIAALMQYGAEDGVLKKLMTPESGETNDGAATSSLASKRHAHPRHTRHERARDSSNKSQSAPQALMLKRGDGESGVTSPAMHDNMEDDASEVGVEADDVVKQLQPAMSTEPEDDPLPFKLAQRLAFSILTTLLDIPFFRAGHDEVPNPYITIFCTFLAHVSFHPEAMRHLERSVPWEALAALFNRISPPVEIRLDTPSKLVGGKPLPEDHCLRGMDWAGRQLFGRGYWREPRSRSAAASPGSGLGTGQGPPIEGIEGTTIRIENEADALRFDLAALQGADPLAARLDDEADDFPIAFSSTAAMLAEGRWRRLAICAAWLVRNVPGFDHNLRTADASQRFGISGALRIKISRWAREDEDAREAERLSRLALEDRSIPSGDLPSTDDDESDEEDFEDENDTDEVKELKSRRRQLKSIIRQARLATRAPRTSKAGGRARLGSKATPVPHVFPGYTILVFDTNILLTSLSLLSELVAAECWTIILPLAVITELDGLRRNDSPLGVAAAEAIDYLEQAVRGYSRYLRVQTSRGNYLKDLAIRNEAIDFGTGPDVSSTQDAARSLDDVILRAASWQKEHFTNRLALVNPRAVADGRKVPSETVQVVLVTFDRNLRLKASARGLEATDEKGLKKAIETAPIGSGG